MPRLLLDRVLSMANLGSAWEKVADNKGSAGADDVSIARFARDRERHLVELRRAVLTNTYKPKRLRRHRVPKTDGEFRIISVPAVVDRVLQRAVLNVIDDVFEVKFLDCSFGYRRGRSLRDAVDRIVGWRDSGRQWVIDADIDLFFDSVDRELLMKLVSIDIEDNGIRRLLDLWLPNPIGKARRGIPLGMPLSPLLANVYLHPLDVAVSSAGLALVRYADDFVVLCRDRDEAVEALSLVEQELAGLRLRLDEADIVHFDHGFSYLGVRFHRDEYSFLAQGKRVEVSGPYVWGIPHFPMGYE